MAQEVIYITTYRQTEATWLTARKFLTNLVGQISNRRLLSKVLEEKNETGRLGARPQAWASNYAPSVRVKKHNYKTTLSITLNRIVNLNVTVTLSLGITQNLTLKLMFNLSRKPNLNPSPQFRLSETLTLANYLTSYRPCY